MDKLNQSPFLIKSRLLDFGHNKITIFDSQEDLFNYAAENFVYKSKAALKIKNEFTVVLSGGETPKKLFKALTSDQFIHQISWSKIKFSFGDERYVSHNNPLSNYYMANEILFSKLPIPKENIFPIPTNYQDPKHAAKEYENTLRHVFKLKENQFPKFDLVYLGLGEDGHTASLMPDSSVVKEYINVEREELVESLWVPKLNMHRITLTPNVINNSSNIIFLVTGLNKSSAVKEVLSGNYDPEKYPAQLIHCKVNQNIWFLDHDAASKLWNKDD